MGGSHDLLRSYDLLKSCELTARTCKYMQFFFEASGEYTTWPMLAVMQEQLELVLSKVIPEDPSLLLFTSTSTYEAYTASSSQEIILYIA